ncbi:MAG: SIMPL domain-containing protein [Nanoarchaeota archaeon]
MDKSVQITLIIVAGIVILGLLIFSGFSNISPSNTVTGNGQANIKAVPDLVGVYFNVQTTGSTSEIATDKNSEIVDNLITELVKQGFERKDIQTTNFNVYPEYNWNSGLQTIKGYKATHSIKVQMSTSDASEIGEVIDAGVDAGAGISYINFELSQEKQNEYKAQALKAAAEDAKIKAQSIAEGLGKRLGSLVSTSDSDFNYSPWRLYEAQGGVAMDAAEAKQATTNIQPGNQDIYASVTATYKLR